MNWMQCLCKTYEEVMKLDITDDEKPVPINHKPQNAHINLVIDGQGNFKRAQCLDTVKIILPATEHSAGRSRGEAPHPLADKLHYVAQDYQFYGGKKPAYFESYHQLLTDWCQSEHTHLSAQAVHKYISKGQVVKDLVENEIVWLDECNNLLVSWADQQGEPPKLITVLADANGEIDQGNALICWTVEDQKIECPDTWKDGSLQQQWIAYHSKLGRIFGLCYVSGKYQPQTLNHPAKLRSSSDIAKLISSNDLGGFTFRGRFADSPTSVKMSGLQSVCIGTATTQKAHHALSWLIRRPKQTFFNGDQVIVTWAVSGAKIPMPLVATTAFGSFDEVSQSVPLLENIQPSKMGQASEIEQFFAEKLNGYLASYREELNDSDHISIMALNSANHGRISLTYYREFMPQDYIGMINLWHTQMAWHQRVMPEEFRKKGHLKSKLRWVISAPAPYEILKAIYGDLIKNNDNIKANLYERLLPCILEGRSIPVDLIKRVVSRACNAQGMRYQLWERTLGVACSLCRCFYLRHHIKEQRKSIPWLLDSSNTSRDYLYGRLLAFAERIEAVAIRTDKSNRLTTANRLMPRFVNRPHETWLILYKKLELSINSLKASKPDFLSDIQQQLDGVITLFENNQFSNNNALTGEFLMGFHCQRLALTQKKQKRRDG